MILHCTQNGWGDGQGDQVGGYRKEGGEDTQDGDLLFLFPDGQADHVPGTLPHIVFGLLGFFFWGCVFLFRHCFLLFIQNQALHPVNGDSGALYYLSPGDSLSEPGAAEFPEGQVMAVFRTRKMPGTGFGIRQIDYITE